MKKRSLLMILALALSLTLAIGGTLAYLQDTDADVNVMTLGDVHIEQHEYERVVDEDGNWVSTGETDKYDYTPDKIKEFTQGKPLYPAVFTDGVIKWDDRNGSQNASGTDSHQQSWGQIGAPGSNQLFDASVKNAIDKFVFVENTGKSDAYVRTWIAMEQGDVAAEDFKSIIMTNTDNTHWNWENVATDVVIGDSEYYVLLATYKGPTSNPTGILAPGAFTYPSLLQVYMRPEATNEDVKAIDGNGNGTYDILVVSQAIQTVGFENAETALNTGFGEASTTSHPWIDINDPEDEKDQDPDVAVVATADELIAALEAGKDVLLTKDIKIDPASMSNAYGTTGINVKNGQTIYGNGYTIDVEGAGGTWDSGINTTGGLIKDLTVTGSFRGIFINHNSTHTEQVVLDNVTTTNTTYTISCDQGTGNGLLATDSTFNGWTSYAATLGDAKFVNCSFNEGNGYAYCRPYAPTEFVGCDFQADYTLDPRAAVTFENCTIGGEPLTAENLDTLVTNTANATVK